MIIVSYMPKNYVYLLFSFILGAISVLGFAPFSYYGLILLSLTCLFLLWEQSSVKQATIQGYFFGLGFMGFGIFWLRISFNEFNHMDVFLSLFLVFGFVAIAALFFALSAYLAKIMVKKFALNQSFGIFLIMAIVWVIVELFRGWVFTGFPWLTIGYAFIDSPLVGFAPFFGVYFISFMVALSAAIIATLFFSVKNRPVAFLGLIIIWLAGFLLQFHSFVQVETTSLRVSLIQANISQNLKWRSEQLMPTLDLYLKETVLNRSSDLIIWPETAIPAMAYRLEKSLLTPLSLQMKQQNRGILTGIPLTVDNKILNTMILLDGTPRQYYAKRHLVPFGEYLPFDFLADLIAYFNIPMSNFSLGKKPPILKFRQFYLGVSICYEDIFPQAIRDSMPQADILLNISNDAWFGDSTAPYQHLQMARMRAVENGRYFIRATNTGISAIMDEKGRVIDSIDLLKQGVLSIDIFKTTGLTLYSRYGNLPLWFILCFLMVMIAMIKNWL